MQTDDDAELLARAAGGNTEAFLKLFESHYRAMYSFAYRLTNATDVAEDLTHECFIRIMRKPTFDQRRGSLRAYLYGTVRNLVRQWQRVTGREVNWDDTADMHNQHAILQGTTTTADISAAVQAAVSALPILQREVIVLCEFEELSLAETAAVVGADVGTVKARLHRARENLRRRLAPYRGHAGVSTTRKKTLYDTTER